MHGRQGGRPPPSYEHALAVSGPVQRGGRQYHRHDILAARMGGQAVRHDRKKGDGRQLQRFCRLAAHLWAGPGEHGGRENGGCVAQPGTGGSGIRQRRCARSAGDPGPGKTPGRGLPVALPRPRQGEDQK